MASIRGISMARVALSAALCLVLGATPAAGQAAAGAGAQPVNDDELRPPTKNSSQDSYITSVKRLAESAHPDQRQSTNISANHVGNGPVTLHEGNVIQQPNPEYRGCNACEMAITFGWVSPTTLVMGDPLNWGMTIQNGTSCIWYNLQIALIVNAGGGNYWVLRASNKTHERVLASR